METASAKQRLHGRWKEPNSEFIPELNIGTVMRELRELRRGISFFRHLTVDREVRICVRYLTDEDYRLTKIAQEIKARPANLRKMFAEYGIDIINRKFINHTEVQN